MAESDTKKSTEKFGGVEIEKLKFHCSKEVIDAINVDIEFYCYLMRLPMTKNKETDAKYFIEYKTGRKIRPLFIELPQTTGIIH